MAAEKFQLLAALVLCLLVSVAFGLRSPQLRDAQQCRVQRFSPSRPFQSLESEGGVIERWNVNDPQFQCAGIAALKIVVRPKSLHLPRFHPTPRVAYVVQGRGQFGITIPGCAETYSSQQQQQFQQGQQGQQQQGDQHQRIRRIRRGDVIAIPAGAAHWCVNHDDNEDLVIIAFNDLNHLANQLDQRLRVFFLAGGGGQQSMGGQQQGSEQQGQEEASTGQNVFGGFAAQILAEAFNAPVETISKMQGQDERGLIVKLEQGASIMGPGQEQEQEQEQEEEQEQQGGQWQGPGQATNGIEETVCSMKLHTNIEQRRQADVYSRQAGKLTVVDKHKMPVLRYMDMSLEKGDLLPNAFVTPHWTMNSHCVIYVVRGEAQVQMGNYNGQNVMNDRVNEGDMVVVPQYFAATIRAGENGCEFVAVKTSGTPMKSPIVGATSVIQAMPLQVVSQIYQISPETVQQLKNNRGKESILLSPSRRSF